jgi:hypothetical protein
MNKFKVGDKVKCYHVDHGELRIFTGHVSAIDNDNNALTKDKLLLIVRDNGLSKYFHYKQCRKLVKKKFKDSDYVTHKQLDENLHNLIDYVKEMINHICHL